MKRLLLPGIPFALSLALSLSTVGAHVGWQDSGFFLVAVKELGVLYPPGFVLYLLLCKTWTLALGFVDFTLAVHLFSSLCAAAAAGAIAVATRDLLRTKGPIFRTVEDEGPLPIWIGAAIGCLAAGGYTFWAAAILAKVYAFYYLILALLLWRMIVADASGKPRDFTIVALLIGLSWQAHPSATTLGLALVLFVAHHRRAIGWKGIAGRTLLAWICATGPILLLWLFPGETSVKVFEAPDYWRFVLGARYSAVPGNWGMDASRLSSVPRFFWEEFLGIGALLATLGVARLGRRLRIGLVAWVLPNLLVTLLFKIEGQQDHWMLASWLPLWVCAGLGLHALRRRELIVAATMLATTWSVVANRKDLDRRDDVLPEMLGRLYLRSVEPGADLQLRSDDALAIVLYLLQVRRERPELSLIADRDIIRWKNDWRIVRYSETPPETGTSRSSGPLFVAYGEPRSPGSYDEPIPAEQVATMFRRARGQFVERRNGELRVRPEPYEKRLLRALLLSRKNHADALSKRGDLKRAAELYESIPRLDPWLEDDASVVYPLAVAYVGLQRLDEADRQFRKALELELPSATRAEAAYFMTALCAERGKGLESAEWRKRALDDPALAPGLRQRLEGR